ncbi:hypothetical protein RvY_06249 [Ramazzottius varieornatus]|uniref:Chitin-binding type-2 domain-containing protein n=1 Tax=Ramazzottius varieornatus TaxID=947166 RepID=A0A1D1UXX0_RAMVA|nr:hypothetical protein RvY_06249 [Ramazzottius varieornatus]
MFFKFLLISGLTVMVKCQRDPVGYFSQNKCFCSESSLFCCLLINNDGDPALADFLYGNTSKGDAAEYYSWPGVEVDVESSQDAVEAQPVRHRVEFMNLPDFVEPANLTDVSPVEVGGSTVSGNSSTTTTPPPVSHSTGTESDTVQSATNEWESGASNGHFVGSSPAHFGFMGCGQDVCLPKNGLQESERGCGYYLNCWNYCGWTQKCPDFLVFNREKQWCDWPWRLAADHSCHGSWPGEVFKRRRVPLTTERPMEDKVAHRQHNRLT